MKILYRTRKWCCGLDTNSRYRVTASAAKRLGERKQGEFLELHGVEKHFLDLLIFNFGETLPDL
jgi:hypothetical protein